MIQFLRAPISSVLGLFERSVFVRYVFSGGSAAAIDVILLFVLTEYFHVYYLASATFAMTVSFIARFILQKYVTFKDQDEAEAKRQFGYYSILYLLSLAATNALLFVFVEKLHMWYMAAQILSILIIAIGCFFIYKLIIFRK
jgi:putative flippase GtrA